MDRPAVLLLALALAACGFQTSSDECVAVAEEGLYYAAAEPSSLTLGPGQRAAIVALVAAGAVGPDLCTGTFVAEGLILTAAHCELDRPMEAVLSRRLDGDGPRRAVEVRAVHPELDLMLLEVVPSAPETLEPIPPLDGELLRVRGDHVELAGFGETEAGTTGELRFLSEPVVALDDATITVDGRGRSGACHGDSGGPLLVGSPRTGVRVAAVLSAGSPDCTGTDVYVRVDRDWLRAFAPGPLAAGPCGGAS